MLRRDSTKTKNGKTTTITTIITTTITRNHGNRKTTINLTTRNHTIKEKSTKMKN